MSLEENIAQVKANIAAAAREAGRDPAEITLVAATKVQTSDTIRAAIAAGVTICGENRVQEMTAHLDDNAYAGSALHFIGHLQTNKVKYVGAVSVRGRKLFVGVHRVNPVGAVNICGASAEVAFGQIRGVNLAGRRFQIADLDGQDIQVGIDADIHIRLAERTGDISVCCIGVVAGNLLVVPVIEIKHLMLIGGRI